jgi:hypothetical protein
VQALAALAHSIVGQMEAALHTLSRQR